MQEAPGQNGPCSAPAAFAQDVRPGSISSDISAGVMSPTSPARPTVPTLKVTGAQGRKAEGPKSPQPQSTRGKQKRGHSGCSAVSLIDTVTVSSTLHLGSGSGVTAPLANQFGVCLSYHCKQTADLPVNTVTAQRCPHCTSIALYIHCDVQRTHAILT